MTKKEIYQNCLNEMKLAHAGATTFDAIYAAMDKWAEIECQVSVQQTAIEFAQWKDDNFFQGANGYTKKGWSGYSSYGDGTIKTVFALFIQERGEKNLQDKE